MAASPDITSRPRRLRFVAVFAVVALLMGAGCAKKEFFQQDETWFSPDATKEPEAAPLAPEPAAGDVSAIVRLLESEAADDRRRGVEALVGADAQSRAALPALTNRAVDAKELTDVRVSALAALAAVGPWHETVVPSVAALVDDPDEAVAEAAVRTLGRFEENAAPAAPRLVRALGDPRLHNAAIEALTSIGPPAVDALMAGARDDNAARRKASQEILSRLGNSSVPALLKELRQPSDFDGAVKALAAVGPVAIPELTKATTDKNDNVRRGACVALGLMGPDARSASEAVVKTTNDPVPSVRAAAQYALGRFGPVTGPQVQAVIWGLRDSDPGVRRAAAPGMLKVGPDAEPEAVDVLAKASSDHRWHVRAEVVSALGRVGPAAATAVPALVKRLSDSDPNVRERAARSLGQIGNAADSAISDLRKSLSDTHPHVREAAREAIAAIEKPAE